MPTAKKADKGAPSKAVSDSQTHVTRASQVAAEGATQRHVQFPSPIYFTEWISDTHVIVGAGGGGHRFGMANVIAMLSIKEEVQCAPNSDDCESVRGKKSGKKSNAQHKTKINSSCEGSLTRKPPVQWAFADALDLGDRVPWCCTHFTGQMQPLASPANGGAAQRTTSNLFGFLVVSHMASFSLLRVVSTATCGLGGGAVGISGGGLSLEQGPEVMLAVDDSNPDKKPVAHHVINSDHVLVIAGQDDGSVIGVVVDVMGDSNSAEFPKAAWRVDCRTNDVTVSKRSGRPLQSDEYTVVAAQQDKRVRIATCSIVFETEGSTVVSSVQWTALLELDGTACQIPFPLMRSSLKFVRFVSSVHVLLVAYDAAGGWSYATIGDISSVVGRDTSKKPVTVFHTQASKLFDEGVTCITALTKPASPSSPDVATDHDRDTSNEWLMGTVEGSILHVVAAPSLHNNPAQPHVGLLQVVNARPTTQSRRRRHSSSNTKLSSALCIPHDAPLHREPVSSVSVSPCQRIVVTTDIAQNLILSQLPSSTQVQQVSDPKEKSPSAACVVTTWDLFPGLSKGGAGLCGAQLRIGIIVVMLLVGLVLLVVASHLMQG